MAAMKKRKYTTQQSVDMQRQSGRMVNEARGFEREGMGELGKMYRRRAKKLVEESLR